MADEGDRDPQAQAQARARASGRREPSQWLVRQGREEWTFGARDEALRAAKERTEGVRHPAEVSDDRDWERFTYRRGELETYVYDPPRRRH